jgi:pimeloyl-ACP methyl ester carboxylesterase
LGGKKAGFLQCRPAGETVPAPGPLEGDPERPGITLKKRGYSVNTWEKLTYIILMVFFVLSWEVGSAYCAAPVMNCADIKSLVFTDSTFNRPVTINSAQTIAATPVAPEYCEVKGTMWPEIVFVVALPTKGTPNAKLYQVGGGAWGGAIPTAATLAPGLLLGYTAAGNNAGHDVVKEPGASFAWNNPNGTNPEYLQKIKDFGYRANVETNILARKLIRAFYGIDASHAYWVGCSQGGREGMTLSQKYPDLWDGFVVGAPAPGVTWLNLRGLWNSQWGQVFYDVPPSSPVQNPPNAAVLKKDKLITLAKAVYDKCDSIDGLVDGFIDDPRKCTFDPLRDLLPFACSGEVDVPNSGCFTLAQRTALKKMYDGITDSKGTKLFPGVGMSAEYFPNPADIMSAGFGIALYDRNAPSFVSYVNNPAPGPTYDWLRFNWDKDWQPIANLGYSQFWDHALYQNDQFVPTQGGLEALRARGGKVIHYHGLGDVMSPTSSMFYDTILKTMGSEKTQNFYKLYLVPGMGHCRGGIGCYDGNTNLWFLPLVEWVEKGIEPKALTGTRTTSQYLTARTRPLCPYPLVARYNGRGSIDEARNFSCLQTIKTDVRIRPNRISIGSAKPSTFSVTISLPRQGDWRATAAVCEGALAEKLVRQGRSYKAVFNKQNLQNITAGGKLAFAATFFVEPRVKHQGPDNTTPIALEGTETVQINQ